MKLEVCIDLLQSASNAVYNGADELEVCSNLNVGGLTPSVEFVKQIIDMVDLYVSNHPKPLTIVKPKINVMIRCREGWDFCYNNNEIACMMEEIATFKELVVDRFVFGALTESKEIDLENCMKIIAQAAPKPMTFHRAFDKCTKPFEALNDIADIGFDRLLTSGMQESVANEKAIEFLKSFLQMYGDRIDIMPGAGVTHKNAEFFAANGFEYLHGTFSRETKSSQGDVTITDGLKVKVVKEIIRCDQVYNPDVSIFEESFCEKDFKDISIEQ